MRHVSPVAQEVGTEWAYNASLVAELGAGDSSFGMGGSMFYLSVFFSVTFVLLSALVMLSLFVGVVTTSMESAAATQKRERAENLEVISCASNPP